MPFIAILFLLLILPIAQAQESLSDRLAQVADNAEQISNHLLSQPSEQLSAEDWLVLTDAQLRLRNKDAAMDAASRVLESTNQPYLQAYAYLLKAQIYGILYRDTAIAITQLASAEHLLQAAEDQASLALYSDVLQNFAQAYNQLGNIPQALPYAERSLTLAQQQQQPDAELKARITLGRLLLQNNAYSLAFMQLNQALILAAQLNDEEALASIHFRLGMAYRKIEYHKQALQHLFQAKQRYQQLQRPSSYTYTLIYIAETYLEDRNTATEAASYLAEALSQARQQDDLLRVGIATLGLGRLAVIRHEEESALQYFSDALQLFRQQNVQTYQQETSLALADLLLQRQQYQSAEQLLQELAPQMPQAAVYLRYRYHDLAARLFAHQGEWAQAYSSVQQANTLRFDQLAEQSKLQLDLMNQGLQLAEASRQSQTELEQLQRQNSQQRQDVWLLLAAVVLLLLTLAVTVSRLRRPNRSPTKVMRQQDTGWNIFCHRIQSFSSSADFSLLAFAPSYSQQLKLFYGEQRLQQELQQFLQQLSPENVPASCIHDDVMWLAVNAPTVVVSALQADMVKQLQQLVPVSFAQQTIVSLQIPLPSLLEKPWLIPELTALREAFWLSWALAGDQPSPDHCLRMTLLCTNPGACEWRSNMVRQDLCNAIRLGSIRLECNGRLLPTTIADQPV
jgi:tetratricopeptide (TPR) repeat protein